MSYFNEREMNMKTPSTPMPSRKEQHKRQPKDWSQHFRKLLLVTFFMMVLGFIYWGYDETTHRLEAVTVTPGIETEGSEDTSSNAVSPGLPALDLSGQTEADTETAAETNDQTETIEGINTTEKDHPDIPFSGDVHEVQEGETLYSIAMKYYSNNEYVARIMALNNIEDETKVYVGLSLKLPSKSAQ
jgi:LysM repeat protein